MLWKIEGRRTKGRQRMKWLDEMHYWLNGHEFEQAPGVGDWREAWCAAAHGVAKCCTQLSDWTELNWTMLYLVASVVSDSVTSWIAVCQAPLSIGILQARILEWVTMLSSRGSSQPSDPTQVSRIVGRFPTSWATREVQPLNKITHILTFVLNSLCPLW